jgi:hypothetical protein
MGLLTSLAIVLALVLDFLLLPSLLLLGREREAGIKSSLLENPELIDNDLVGEPS